ncbi:MAG: Malto-oligosyltrehalose synthase [Chthoniobacteraceae bacterium]|nr:Malto-oligosyltrehalose synthase [Chthoniobacteraceae bacterium]
MNHPSIPSATYRLQFHKGFTFADAKSIVPYLAELGVSHLYASPIFRATPGSMHGYDICDHNQLNPELGTEADFEALTRELAACGMSLILDFVPNHMGIAEASNRWWMDVLENGPSSIYASFFDIEWSPVKRELENKVLLPILGDQYGHVLEGGALKLAFEHGAFFLDYFDHRLPLAPRTIKPLLQESATRLLASGHTVPSELESIVFALDYLPSFVETGEVAVADRLREKEIIKKRLAQLCDEAPELAEAIAGTIEEVQSGGRNRDFELFDSLLTAQPYRLAFWRVAAEEINYRRFFDINNLAAIRVELPEVFEATHQLVMKLIASGSVTGLRIDHVDGLWDPREYLHKLQQNYAAFYSASADDKPLYLLVEKILGRTESLRHDWPVHGTTGYEFGAQVINVLIDSRATEALTETYEQFIGTVPSYPELVYRGKLLTMRASMASEVNVLAHMLNGLSETNRWYRDFTANSLATAIREVIACFPVYRTYVTPDGDIRDEDVRIILRAIAHARRRNPALERSVFEFIRNVLVPPSPNPHPVDEESRRRFVLKLQQCTGPITAKGVEDTAFYVYNRLIALNEVGCEPGSFGSSIAQFHDQNAARAAQFPHSLLATSTHDTKRSEDVRARLAALSEMPREWGRAVRQWQRTNSKFRKEIDGEFAPDANEEYLLYQTLLGCWPLEPMSAEELATYIGRIKEYMVKALHEAKVNSSWMEPNEPWDKAVGDFVEQILTPSAGNRFLSGFTPLAARVAELGALNSLAQIVLKFTVPGVPDVYQGEELWDFSLVDPDNRRPVDYNQRISRLDALMEPFNPADLLVNWPDGRIKLFITHKLLSFRKENAELFKNGSYEPVAVEGEFADCCIAFERRHGTKRLLVIVPRLTSRVATPPVGASWRDTRLLGELNGGLIDLFTGRPLGNGQSVALDAALRDFPFAVYFSN